MTLLKLVLLNLFRHWMRSLLTIGSLIVALFLLSVLRSLVTTLESGIEAASSRRMVVQSAVSLFVDLPLSYQAKIAAVPGVEDTCKWQWFGAYYQDEQNQFSQFAVDPDNCLDFFPELEIVAGSNEAFVGNRRGCVIGEGLSQRFGWEQGDTVPLIGMLFPHPDGVDVAWEFEVEAIYRPTVRNFDSNVMFFHWDYFEKTQEASDTGAPGIGTIYLKLAPDAEPTVVMAAVDGLFANGPQRVQTTPEAEFQAQFISMFGNIPFFVSAIGGAVTAAILLACVNTMLMAAREQTKDVGVLKALGFTDASMFGLFLVEALVLCVLGGGLGIGLALLLEPGIAAGMGSFFPGFAVETRTIVLGIVVTLGVGLLAGIVPALRASRLRCVEALGATE